MQFSTVLADGLHAGLGCVQQKLLLECAFHSERLASAFAFCPRVFFNRPRGKWFPDQAGVNLLQLENLADGSDQPPKPA